MLLWANSRQTTMEFRERERWAGPDPLEESDDPGLPLWPGRLALLYLGGVLLAWFLSRYVAEGSWWTTLLLYVPQVAFFLPMLVVLPPALWFRHPGALLVIGLTVVLITGPIMAFNVPRPSLRAPAAPAVAPRVRVLTYNIRGATKGIRLIQQQVKRYRPDVAVFCEARGWNDDAKLTRSLAATFPGWHTYADGDVYIASRWPLVERVSADLGGYEADEAPPRRKRVTVVTEAPFGRFSVTGVHFRTAVYGQSLLRQWRHLPGYMQTTGLVRRSQAEELVEFLTDRDEPQILAGDFNTPPTGRVYGRLVRYYEDAFAHKGWGWGYTYPSRFPVLRIDYVFHTRHFRTVNVEVGPAPGSDHRPVFAELALIR